MRGITRPIRTGSSVGTTWVAIEARPLGSSESVDVSRSPNTVMATVRGIGVAVMTRTCGGRWSRSEARVARAARCSTPNRCCSSTTTSPRSRNCTRSSSSAWVPMTMPASPETVSSSACRLAAVPIEPVSSATLVPRSAPPSIPRSASGPSSSVIDRRCCCARTSVGASRAACPPASTTVSMARSATTVLPDPTSPCSSRCMGCSWASSAVRTSPTSRCPSVRVNGSRASNAWTRPPSRATRGVASRPRAAALRRASTTWRTYASSKRNRRCACCQSRSDSGRWISRNDSVRSGKP